MGKKNTTRSLINTVNDYIDQAKDRGIVHLYAKDDNLDGRELTIHGRKVVNFGSCSYLGLETDERLKKSAIEAVEKFGTQFSSSRTYTSCGNYSELEDLLSKMFNTNILLSTSSSLGHQSVMPIVIEPEDAVIFDQQAHISMQEMSYKLSHNGTQITIVRHSNLEELERKINEFQNKVQKIWYAIDGVYSMYGDFAPLDELVKLLDKYKQLHLYVDDAHGMSWRGENGTGYVLSEIELHPKMVMATSLAKGFGSCGGVFLFPDRALRDRVKNWGGPITYSGPQQPGTVGASIASAKLHLSDEIEVLQEELRNKIAFTNQVFKKYELPLVTFNDSPIFFVGLGLTRMGYNMIGRLMDDGYYTNLGIFPAVPETCTGIRFTITNHLTYEDIEGLAERISYHLPLALAEEDRTMDDIYRAFRKVIKYPVKINKAKDLSSGSEKDILQVEQYASIKEIDRDLWNQVLGKQGQLTYDNLVMYEEVFDKNIQIHNNWNFNYIIIKDRLDKVVVAAYTTGALVKDDMMSSDKISQIIEKERAHDPGYLTSNALMVGSLLTNGNHLYVDNQHALKHKAMVELLDTIWKYQDTIEASTLIIRDFDAADDGMKRFFMNHGFLQIEMSEDNVISNITEPDMETFLAQRLNKKKRKEFRKDVMPYLSDFEYKVQSTYTDEELAHFYKLYKNVKQNSFAINTFDLPFKLFKEVSLSKGWEIVQVVNKDSGKLASVVLCQKTESSYLPTVIGMDYAFQRSNIYKVTLYQLIDRAIQLGLSSVLLGLTASDAKRKFGAESIPQVGYVQTKDNFNNILISSLEFEHNVK